MPVIHGARQVTAQLLFIRLYLQFLNVWNYQHYPKFSLLNFTDNTWGYDLLPYTRLFCSAGTNTPDPVCVWPLYPVSHWSSTLLYTREKPKHSIVPKVGLAKEVRVEGVSATCARQDFLHRIITTVTAASCLVLLSKDSGGGSALPAQTKNEHLFKMITDRQYHPFLNIIYGDV